MGLFLRHAVEYDILLRKSGKPLQLVLLVGAGLLFERMAGSGRWRKITLVILLLAALPTIGFDIQAFGGFGGSRGMENYLALHEIKALNWIKSDTPPNAVVQGKPGYRGDYLYEINPIPPLAERPVAVGTFMLSSLWGVGARNAIARTRAVDSMFQAETANDVAAMVERFNVDYLYIGPRERAAYELRPESLWEDTMVFETVYDRDSVLILQLRVSTRQIIMEPPTQSQILPASRE